MSQYQKKPAPTHTHEEEEGLAQTTKSALSQRGLLDPTKPAYNQSRPDGQLKLTAITFNDYGSVCWQSWSQYYCYASFINFSIIARHLLDFVVQGKTTEVDTPTVHLDATPSRLSVPPLPSSLHFYAECPFCHSSLNSS